MTAMFRGAIFVISLLLAEATSAQSLTVADFNRLPVREQDQLLKVAQDAATLMITWVSSDPRVRDQSTMAKDLQLCLLDRDVAWLRKSFREYEVEFKGRLAATFSGAVVHTIAWRCNYLSIQKSE
jgi:hypothetical protein